MFFPFFCSCFRWFVYNYCWVFFFINCLHLHTIVYVRIYFWHVKMCVSGRKYGNKQSLSCNLLIWTLKLWSVCDHISIWCDVSKIQKFLKCFKCSYINCLSVCVQINPFCIYYTVYMYVRNVWKLDKRHSCQNLWLACSRYQCRRRCLKYYVRWMNFNFIRKICSFR